MKKIKKKSFNRNPFYMEQRPTWAQLLGRTERQI